MPYTCTSTYFVHDDLILPTQWAFLYFCLFLFINKQIILTNTAPSWSSLTTMPYTWTSTYFVHEGLVLPVRKRMFYKSRCNIFYLKIIHAYYGSFKLYHLLFTVRLYRPIRIETPVFLRLWKNEMTLNIKIHWTKLGPRAVTSLQISRFYSSLSLPYVSTLRGWILGYWDINMNEKKELDTKWWTLAQTSTLKGSRSSFLTWDIYENECTDLIKKKDSTCDGNLTTRYQYSNYCYKHVTNTGSEV